MKHPFILTTMAGLLAVAGCSTVNTVENTPTIGARQMVADKRVITDIGLNTSARVVGVNVTTGEFMKVQVEVVNLTHSVKSFNYQFQWFDATGMEVASPASSYITRQIEGQETLYLTGVAPTPLCRDFRLKMIDNVR